LRVHLCSRVSLYWHTLRYLKFVQIYRRAWFRLNRPKPKLEPAPLMDQPDGHWVRAAARKQSVLSAGDFFFLNDTGSLDELGWDNPNKDKLWRYNQHYFDDLNADGAQQRTDWHLALLDDWVNKNVPGQGTGWEPYPTSLRIVNWVKWSLAGNTLSEATIHSLAVQTRWLLERLEVHLLGNHYFSNAKALVFVGLAFQGKEAQGWLHTGLQIIKKELPEQVLPDGGNFERSPMYHSIFLEDMLDLINVARAWPEKIDPRTVENWQSIAERMVGWLSGLTHPDGQIALFNDAAFGITPTPLELQSYAQRLAVPSRSTQTESGTRLSLQHWPQSGYIRLAAPAAVVLLDVAPIGPDYLPSHANADTLSFELSIYGQRVIVNGGTSRYGNDVERLRERQTSAHSTVEVDGQSSSEVWGGFRVARRAYPFDLEVKNGADQITVACSHDGYQRLKGSPVHRRSWALEKNRLHVIDTIDGEFKEAIARYFFHPSLKVVAIGLTTFALSVQDQPRIVLEVLAGRSQITQAHCSFEFGKRMVTQCLMITPAANKIEIRVSWADE
jgi:uncharacterized heparinase superfamily protein